MTTPKMFGEGLRMTVLAFAPSLFLIAGIWSPALAEHMPKHRTYSTTWTSSGSYRLIQAGEHEMSWMSEFTIVVWNNAGSGIFHDMTANCNGFGVGNKANGYCSYVDADGDKMFTAWEALGDGEGSSNLLGGTGKYAGIQGSEVWKNINTPDMPEGTRHGHGSSKGNYTLP